MKEFNFGNRTEILDKAKALVEQGISLGLDMRDILKKIESVRSAMKDGIVRIVLLGSFSDGKTSAIAGLLGRLEDTMKIDADESSDEIRVYRPMGLKKGFEIVDTPGLFGTKEKEIDGKSVKFSDITKKYISEAHIVIYVCDAVNPLKESHAPIIKWVLRDLDKLDSTIFVLNKMDEAGYDLLDPDDYEYGSRIKKENLISRLRSTINLTPSEERRLNIICIAADPKGKGLEHWFAKPDEYLKRSHIGDFRKLLENVVDSSDTDKLKEKSSASSIKDLLSSIDKETMSAIKPMERALPKIKDSRTDVEVERKDLQTELDYTRKSLVENIDSYKRNLLGEIRGATVETFFPILQDKIGVEGDKVSFSVFERDLNFILDGAANEIETSINSHSVRFEQEFSDQEKFFNGALKEGSKLLKNVKIDNTQVLAVRDALFSSVKFKPWGATKLAKGITKGFGYAAVAINIGMEAYSWYKQYKQAKDLEKAKKQLIPVLEEAFGNIDKSFNDKETYYQNYAPQYLQLVNELKDRDKKIEEMEEKVKSLESYSSKVKAFLDAEDAEYEEL